ncbi:MAG TPA: hypothetical protein PKU78_04105 [Candidatus Dojkabacteria bacterium]|nr:hypothetical protein [Candidatus Dojkabacteria bacterium]HRO65376.1 hypothetical protein [Candidatus Dojkabacteria bacterium]HRP37187.1 hypothetical protein [Candidatus Dojkabacteria bacterium]HRP51846.1 hypothetical protein [Candidatus Dojkabacteria bacterium]
MMPPTLPIIDSTPQTPIDPKKELLKPFNSSEKATEAVRELFRTIPPEKFDSLVGNGVLPRILEHVPDQTFDTTPNVLAHAWTAGEDLKRQTANSIPRTIIDTHLTRTRPSNQSGAFATMDFSQKGLNGENLYSERNPGLVLTARLLAVAAGMDNVPVLKTNYAGRIDPKAANGLLAARIITIANGLPEGFSDTMPPQKRQLFPNLEPTPALENAVYEIMRARFDDKNLGPRKQDTESGHATNPVAALKEISQGPKIELLTESKLIALQERLLAIESQLGSVSQFSGQDGLRNIDSILKAMDVYEDIFQPRPETPNP